MSGDLGSPNHDLLILHKGRYPKDMCWCETTWRALPFRRRFFSSFPSVSSERDENFVKERIFDLVFDSKASWHEVQLLLQVKSIHTLYINYLLLLLSLFSKGEFF